MPRDSAVTIVNIRPRLLGTYGDRGNALVLRHRLVARGFDAVVLDLDGSAVVPNAADLILFGGGEDSPQQQVARDEPLRRSVEAAVAAGAGVLAVCAGFQVLGSSFAGSDGTPVAGFGLLDCVSTRLPRRAVGELLVQPSDLSVGVLTGFENHLGRTDLGESASPLGSVVSGVGNDGEGHEGAVCGRVIGTYLHGPVLARNPDLADLLLERVVGPLNALDDALVEQLRAERLSAVAPRRWRFRRGRRRG